jgi:hypothetical protein
MFLGNFFPDFTVNNNQGHFLIPTLSSLFMLSSLGSPDVIPIQSGKVLPFPKRDPSPDFIGVRMTLFCHSEGAKATEESRLYDSYKS